MNQEIKEFSLLQASDGSFIVRSQTSAGALEINTYKEFPDLIKGLEQAFFSPPSNAVPAPTQAQ